MNREEAIKIFSGIASLAKINTEPTMSVCNVKNEVFIDVLQALLGPPRPHRAKRSKVMKISELCKELYEYIRLGQGDDVVMIKTQDPSVGAQSSIGITGISSGFDWDDGHIFINPSRPLTSKPSRYLDSFSVVRQESGGVSFWACPKCYMRVAKDDSYCKYCGTKLAKPAKPPRPGAIGPETGEMAPNGDEGSEL